MVTIMDISEIIIKKLKELGADNAAKVAVKDIRFEPQFRDLCVMNHCGLYGKCWMCPPDAGDVNELIARARKYEHAVVYQTIGKLEDSFDIEGMEEASDLNTRLTVTFRNWVREQKGIDWLLLNKGGCGICNTCSKANDEPCPFPEEALESLDSYGVYVSELAKLAGMNYINGTNTVTYFGALLYNEAENK